MQRLGFARAFLGAQPSPDYRGRKVFIKMFGGLVDSEKGKDGLRVICTF